MLITNMLSIGEKLLKIRKNLGLTQSEAAERAGLSDRTYADIERGTVNMRVETLLKICAAFKITPDEILTEDKFTADYQNKLFARLDALSSKDRQTALQLLTVYLDSLK